MSVCNVKFLSFAPRPPDILSALLYSVHFTKLGYVSFDFGKLPSYANLRIPLLRTERLLNRVESVDDVHFNFLPSSSPAPQENNRSQEKDLKRVCQAFESVFNTLLSKSCAKIQFTNLHTCEFGLAYKFRREAKDPTAQNSILRRFKGGIMRSGKEDQSTTKPALMEEDLHYFNPARRSSRGRVAHILPSPSALLQASKLTRFEAASTNLFQPPFSAWAFSALQASKIEHFAVGFRDLTQDEDEKDYILARIAASLSEVIILTIFSVPESHAHRILTWINAFPKVGTLSLPLNFPTELSPEKIDLHLPELWRLELAPELLNVLFSKDSRIDLPKLNSVAITHHGLNVPLLAETIPKARELITSRTPEGSDCLLFVALRLNNYHLMTISQALREGKRPKTKEVDLSSGFEGVSPLELSLPGTREDVKVGIYDNDIMALLTLFPDVASLILCSTEWYLKRAALPLDREQLKKFRQRCPKLYSLVVY
jgi:hypothetical protein